MDKLIIQAVDALAQDGWCHVTNFLSSEQLTEINGLIDQWLAGGKFKRAGIGKGERLQNNDSVRRDVILWVDDVADSLAVQQIIKKVDELRVQINRELFAGIESFEGHFAVYQLGGFYKRHVDTFRDDDGRAISMILYLNHNWQDGDGGELLLELAVGQDVKITPSGGSLVLFDARRFPHEVLPSNAERRSFTGWFKVRQMSR